MEGSEKNLLRENARPNPKALAIASAKLTALARLASCASAGRGMGSTPAAAKWREGVVNDLARVSRSHDMAEIEEIGERRYREALMRATAAKAAREISAALAVSGDGRHDA